MPSNTAGAGYATAIDTIFWENRTRSGSLVNYTATITTNCCTTTPQFVDELQHIYLLRQRSACVGTASDGGNIGAYGIAPQDGFAVGTAIEGYGVILEPGTMVSPGGNVTFTAGEIGRPFLHFMTNGVIATTSLVLELTNVQSDILVTAVFAPNEYYVNASRSNDNGNGLTWATAKRTIGAAMNIAVDYDHIIVTNGIYAPITSSYYGKRLTVKSVNGSEYTTIDGAGSSTCASLGENGSAITNTILLGFTLQNGYSSYYGGGAWGGVLKCCRIFNCESARSGGGAMGSVLENCLVAGNRAAQGGGLYGGICINGTICGNHAMSGGGTYSGTIVNSIVYGNTADGISDNYYQGSYSYSYTTPIHAGTGNLTGDPMLVDAVNGDGRLRVGSPCLNAGNSALAVGDFDVVRNPRIVDGRVDMGAFEGHPVSGYVVSVGIEGNGGVSDDTIVVTQGGTATVVAAETARPFLYFVVDGTNRVYNSTLTLSDISGDHYIVAVFTNYTFYVDSARPTDSGNGLSWTTAKRNLQTAISVALNGERIIVADGVYSSIATQNKAIVIESVNGADSTIIDGGGTNRCASLAVSALESATNTVLIGFTLRNGYEGRSYFTYGGGSYGGTLSRCIISNCTSAATTGNGGYDCAYGGGAYYGVLDNCLIVGNYCRSPYCSYGGGVYGAILRNCTVARNSATGGTTSYGEGAASGGGASGGTAYNSIVWGNEIDAPRLSGTNSANTYLYSSCVDASANYRYSGTITDAPEFLDSDAGDYRLALRSPCIDVGNNAYVRSVTDLNGISRIQGASVDMGCFEGGYCTRPPSIVQGLSVSGSVLSWDGQGDALEYRVYRSVTNIDASATLVGTTSETMYSDTTGIPGAAFYRLYLRIINRKIH